MCGFLITPGTIEAAPIITITSPTNNATLTENVGFNVVTTQGGHNFVTDIWYDIYLPDGTEVFSDEEFVVGRTTTHLLPGLPAGEYVIVVTYVDTQQGTELATDSITITVAP